MEIRVQDMYIPKEIFFTNGFGEHKEKLISFELALRDAGIEKCNLVEVSSILPPDCKVISKEVGLKSIKPGQITFCILARNSSHEHGKRISAAIGCALPEDKKHFGYIGEHCSLNQSSIDVGKHAEKLAAEMLASKLGSKFNIYSNYDENKKFYKIENKIFKTLNIAKSAICKDNSSWITVIAVAVFIM